MYFFGFKMNPGNLFGLSDWASSLTGPEAAFKVLQLFIHLFLRVPYIYIFSEMVVGGFSSN